MSTLQVTERMNHLLKAKKKYRTYHGAQMGIQLRIINENIDEIKQAYISETNRLYIHRRLETLEKCLTNISALMLDMELEQ
ncbi:hypothetical protein [Arcanobacterium haemolyticum]